MLFTATKDKARILLNEFKSVFTSENLCFVPWLGRSLPRIPTLFVTSRGVEKLLSHLKPHKAAGPDKIPGRILKELASELAPALSAFFNQTITQGCVPKGWTEALISPVYKKDNVHDASNYRPVSLTSVTCKVLEHIICKHILDHLDHHNAITSYQHGFRRSRSCETQLLLTLDDLMRAYDKKHQVDIGILDFSRAFDTVPHERLLGKLSYYGIKGPLQFWIRSFLANRTMRVVIDGETSSTAHVKSGVPQGTVLGPLLFLIYINDLPDQVSEGTTVRLFADDCLVYRQIHSISDQLILQRDLLALQSWALKWGMRFNPKKCNIMQVARSNPLTKIYEMCDEALLCATDARYLGVSISNDLQWEKHI